MSSTRMLVLGVIKMHQPVHGYDVSKELLSWHVEEWASVQRGSIYSALKTLTKEGMVEMTGSEQVGERPERTLFAITAKGDAELSRLLHETLWDWQMPVDPLLPAIALLPYIKREELIAGLEARVAQIKASLYASQWSIEKIVSGDTPAHVGEMLRLIHARIGAEMPWSKAFVDRLKKGEYITAGDPIPKKPPKKIGAFAKKKAATTKKTVKKASKKS